MKTRTVTRDEAEQAFSQEFAGVTICYDDGKTARIAAVRLPETPSQGGVAGGGYLPLTYVFEDAGETTTYETGEGPEVDEARAFLRATLSDFRFDQRLELWFEGEWSPEPLGPGCC